jgi:predicted small secreted protein
MKPVLILGVFTLIAGLALTGCSNTFNGAGRDIEHAGQKIQQTF